MDPIGVGIIGLSAAGGWAAQAHVAAIEAVDGISLRALCASTPASARAAGEHYAVRAVSEAAQLVADDQVDLVVITVRVPRHRELVQAALAAGKAVLCEWPLGVDAHQAAELTDAGAGMSTFVGLQGRAAPATRMVRDLVSDGYVGEVLSTTMVGAGVGWGAEVRGGGEYLLDRANGATMLTIAFGHAFDTMTSVLGDLTDVTATTAVRRPLVRLHGTSRTIPMTAADQLAVSGMLASGAVASIHYRGGRSRGADFCWEINGTEGDLRVTSTSGQVQFGLTTVEGARGDEPFAELAVPAGYDAYPGLIGTPSNAVAHAYAQLLADLRDGTSLTPDFEHAVRLHRRLEAVELAAHTGQRQPIS